MRIVLLGLLAIVCSGAGAQTDSNREDIFHAIGNRLNMSAGSVRAMMKREGLLAQVEAFFPQTVELNSPQLIVGDEAYAIAKMILNGGANLVRRATVEVADDVDADQFLMATLRTRGKSVNAVCAAILPGRDEATGSHRSRILDKPAHNKITDATPGDAEDGANDEVMRQVQRMIKEMRTSDYVCHLS